MFNRDRYQLITAPDFGRYEGPQPCPRCGTTFVLEQEELRRGEPVHIYRAQCDCPGASMITRGSIYMQDIWIERIGQPKNGWCQDCKQAINSGDPVRTYTVSGFPYYLHPECFDAYAARMEAYDARDAQAAAQPAIVVWFGWDREELRSVTGALADGQTRMLPASFPSFDESHVDGQTRMLPASFPSFDESHVIVREVVRRPLAQVVLEFLFAGDAEALWAAATSVPDVGCELHWKEVVRGESTQVWAGSGFSAALSDAKIKELQAEPLYGD